MRRRRIGRVREIVLLVFASLVAATAVGHRAPGSLTTVEWNPQTGRTEIVHRLHSHDAELGVGTILGLPTLSVLSIEGRAHIALYVEERFSITTNDDVLPLDLVGAEVAADYLLIYQEWQGPLPQRVQVRDDILRDVFPAQINQVNLQDGERVRSLVFAGDDTWHPFEFGGN